MPPSTNRSNQGFNETLTNLRPSAAFVVMIFAALIAFEIFNYSTTDHALQDLLGGLTFAGIPWSTVLALAFCGIDFAGIARLFTPEQGADEPKEVWYLFGAWLLAATMNAILTWWGVSMAVANHTVQSSSVVDPKTITSVVPVFVAIMVWVIRILIIGTLSLAMDRLLHPGAEQRTALQSAISASHARPSQAQSRMPAQASRPLNAPAGLNSAGLSQRPSYSRQAATQAQQAAARNARPVVEEPEYAPDTAARVRPEPTYHTLSMSPRPSVTSDSRGGENTGANRFRRS